MKKLITRILIGTLVLGVAGIGGTWFVISSKAVSQTETLIAELNAKALPQNGTLKITYDSLSRSSFPAVGVRLTNPVITAHIPVDAQGRPAIDAVWKRTGTIDVITDHLNHQYRVMSDGADMLQVKSGAENVDISSDTSHVALAIASKKGKAIDDWKNLTLNDNEAIKKILDSIGMLNITVSQVTVKDKASEAVIYSQEPSHIDFINRSTESTVDFDLDLAINGTEATKEYGVVATRLLRALQMPLDIWSEEAPFSSVRAGKQTMAAKISVNMPTKQGPVSNGFVHAPVISIKNNFYHIEAPFDVVMKEENATRTAKVYLNAMAEVAPATASETMRSLDTLDSQPTIINALKQFSGSKETEIDPKALKEKIAAVLPTLSTLGAVNLHIDFDASVPAVGEDEPLTKPEKGAAPNEHLTIRAFNFNHARWGLETKGMVARAGGSAPSLDVNILCKRCDQMTKDIYDAAVSTQDLLNLINPKRTQWPLNETLFTNVTTALSEIGKKDIQSGDITFGITANASGEFNINNRPALEVMPKLSDALSPLTMGSIPSPEQLAIEKMKAQGIKNPEAIIKESESQN